MGGIASVSRLLVLAPLLVTGGCSARNQQVAADAGGAGEGIAVRILDGDQERMVYLPRNSALGAAWNYVSAGGVAGHVTSVEGGAPPTASADLFAQGRGSFSEPVGPPAPDPHSTIGTRLMRVEPQYWYKRSDYAGAPLNVPRYREGNYTPGFHTSQGYIRGHYRTEGVYTRGEHRTEGYIRGDYRGSPMPSPAPRFQSITPVSPARGVPVR